METITYNILSELQTAVLNAELALAQDPDSEALQAALTTAKDKLDTAKAAYTAELSENPDKPPFSAEFRVHVHLPSYNEFATDVTLTQMGEALIKLGKAGPGVLRDKVLFVQTTALNYDDDEPAEGESDEEIPPELTDDPDPRVEEEPED